MLGIKITGCIMVLLSSIGIGLVAGGEYRRRINILKELYTIVFVLRGNIRFSNMHLAEAIESVEKNHKGELCGILTEAACNLDECSGKSMAQIWNTTCEKRLNMLGVGRAEGDIIKSFGECFSSTDKESLLISIERFLSNLSKETEKRQAVADSRAKLYRNLGALTGVFIIILLF